MSSEETVKLEVTLAWSYAHNATRTDEWDTGLTIAEWNDMSAEARDKEMTTAYQETLARYDSGGVSVITEGAKD